MSNAFVVFVWLLTFSDQVLDYSRGSWTPANFGVVMALLVTFTICWYVLVAAIGWIARGFLEPRG